MEFRSKTKMCQENGKLSSKKKLLQEHETREKSDFYQDVTA